MKRAQRSQQGTGALELIEEAVHLLRRNAVSSLWIYYLGTMPFVLGLLYFWAEMSRSAYAEQHLPAAALGLGLLFVWMKFWQAVFARHLRARVAGRETPLPNLGESWNLVVIQGLVQPTALFLLPLSLIMVLPFGWVCAFFQNVTAAAPPIASVRSTLRHAHRMAWLWPRQNHRLLITLAAFAFCVLLNWSAVCYLLPALAKMLFAIESVFTRSGSGIWNTTFFAVVLGLTYLSVDPILKAAYVLRCFYGESLNSGADLHAGLAQLRVVSPTLPAMAMAGLLLVGAACAAVERSDALGDEPSPPRIEGAEGPAKAPSKGSRIGNVDPARLDSTIEEVIQQRKYSWRMPREKLAEPEKEQGVVMRFLTAVGQAIDDFFKWVQKWIKKLQRQPQDDLAGPHSVWTGGVSQILLYLLLAAVVVAVVILLLKAWRGRLPRTDPVQAEAIQTAPDLTDENVGAEQLPEDGWTRLGRELLAKGEYRLAMRAFYLSGLAHLAENRLITLARFKSNRDYERELGRRGHALPGVLAVFGDAVEVFERVWYGSHAADLDLANGFLAKVQELKGGGA